MKSDQAYEIEREMSGEVEREMSVESQISGRGGGNVVHPEKSDGATTFSFL